MGNQAVLEGGRSLWERSEIWTKLCFQLALELGAPATIPKTTRPRACCEETLVCQLAWEPGQAQPLATHSASSILPPALQAARAARAAEAPRSRWNQGSSLLCLPVLPSLHRERLLLLYQALGKAGASQAPSSEPLGGRQPGGSRHSGSVSSQW